MQADIDYNNLPKFSKTAPCIKCGSSNITTKYFYPGLLSATLEHLGRICECGYCWEEACIGQSQEEKTQARNEQIKLIESSVESLHQPIEVQESSAHNSLLSHKRWGCRCGWFPTAQWNGISLLSRQDQDADFFREHVKAEIAKRMAEAGLA